MAILAAFVVLPGGVAPSIADAAEFEVSHGHLSASFRDIVESYDWSLVWAADEDRIVDHPFVIGNGSLREALTDLLAIYRGQFVADLYEGNRVVLIDSAPPRIRVVLPGAASGSDQVTVVAPVPAAAAPADAALQVGDAADLSSGDAASVGSRDAPSEAADLPADASTRDGDLASRRFVGE